MKNLRFLIIAVFLGSLLAGCAKSADPSGKTNVTLSMMATTSSGKTTMNGRVMATIALTDVKVNVRDIKFDFDQESHHPNSSTGGNDDQDDHHDQDTTEFNDGHDYAHDSSYVDDNPKLKGPFIVDLVNSDAFVNQVITSVTLPNAKFEKVSFKLVPSTEAGDMNGKSIRITGMIGPTPFIFWHKRDARFGAKFQDSTTLVTNGAALNIAIQLELDKILSAVNGGVDLTTATDGNNDGTISIDPSNVDGNKHLADAIMNLLVRHTHCHEEHDK